MEYLCNSGCSVENVLKLNVVCNRFQYLMQFGVSGNNGQSVLYVAILDVVCSMFKYCT